MSKNLSHLPAQETLSQNDPVMKLLIDRYGDFDLTPHDRYYEELVSSIVSQQLSVGAASTIWKRFIAHFDDVMPSPAQIIKTDTEDLRSVGLSYQKVSYIKDLAKHVLDGSLQIDTLANLPNSEVIKELVAVRGIGVWSAHMFMIFSLGRLDVLAWGDLGIRKSAKVLYDLPSLPDQKALESLARDKGWTPYQSIACWYLWKNLDNKNQ